MEFVLPQDLTREPREQNNVLWEQVMWLRAEKETRFGSSGVKWKLRQKKCFLGPAKVGQKEGSVNILDLV